MKKLIAAIVLTIAVFIAGVVSLAVFATSQAPSGPVTGGTLPSAEALTDIPADFLDAYQRAGEKWGVNWTVIAGVGKVECDHGRSKLAGCSPKGTVNPFGARGPMQFLGSTWRSSAGVLDADVSGPPIPEGSESDGFATDCDSDANADPWNIVDASCATGRMLAHNGGDSAIRSALFAYNHASWYVDSVMAWSSRYDGGPAAAGLPGYTPEGGWALPATSGRISFFGESDECQPMALWPLQGAQASCTMLRDPQLKWYIAMRWSPYTGGAYSWWKAQRILITNPRTGKAVVTFAGDWGPHVDTGRVVDVSVPVMSALAATTDDTVSMRFVHPSTQLGPVTAAALPIGPSTGVSGLATIDWDGRQGGETVTVAASIGARIQALARDARTDQIPVGGWGWRSAESQINLRRSHCGTSHYAIYEMPSGQCSPPTAKPGKSMHEKGLAIDFTCAGDGMDDGDKCHRWLVANAHRYGLLPFGQDYHGSREPWHWSISGN